MTSFEYLIIVVGFILIYIHKLHKLKGHMSTQGIVAYTTIKITTLFIAPAFSWFFASAFLELPESSVTKIVIATFVVTLLVVTVIEDKKIGVIDEVIEDAKKDFWE